MKTKTVNLKKLNDRIKKDNAVFKAASDAEKRVMIAEDVIARVKAGQFKAKKGVWVLLNKDLDERNEAESLQKVIVDENVECECCGVGSLFLSCVAINNKATVKDYLYDDLRYDSIVNGGADPTEVTNLFSAEQLALIEIAFERGKGYYSPKNENIAGYASYEGYGEILTLEDEGVIINKDQYLQAKSYCKGMRSAGDRLIKIMQNIIHNKGTFKL